MSIKVAQECETRFGWQEVIVPSSSSETDYTVSIPPWDRWDLDQISCECISYNMRGWCKHQELALRKLCQWSELESDAAQQTPKMKHDNICPRCGGLTRKVFAEYADVQDS